MKFIIKMRTDTAATPPVKRYWFVLVASNGEPVAASEMYTRKQSAVDTIDAIKSAAAMGFAVLDETGEPLKD